MPHGNVPTLAYRVQVGERSVVFGGDQNGSDPAFARFVAGADVLVMHLALSGEASGPVTELHATPSTVGEVARAAKARRLVLSHLIEAPRALATPEWFSLSGLDAAVAAVREHFAGPVDAAVDLTCVAIP